MVTAETILNIARAEIGTKEANNDNNIKYNTEYYGRTVSGDNYPWCVVFIWWCFKQAGNVNMFCYGKTYASASLVSSKYKSKGTFVTNPTMYRPGDLAWFSGHMAIIESVDLENEKINTIDGNWSNMVKRVSRNFSECYGVCRVPYDIEEVVLPDEPDEEETPEDTPTETPDVAGEGDGLIIVKVYTDGLTGTPLTYNADGQTLLSPFSECFRLDEALDNASITLAFIDRKEPFEPFTFVSLDDTNIDNDTEFWCVQNDEVTEYPAIGRYTHKLLLVETTKYLERFMVGTKTVTQPIVKGVDFSNIQSAQKYVPDTNAVYYKSDDVNNPYITPTNIENGLIIFPFKDIFQYLNEVDISVHHKITIYADNTIITVLDFPSEEGECAIIPTAFPDNIFFCKIKYEFGHGYDYDYDTIYPEVAEFSFIACKKETLGIASTYISIYDVIQILCDIADLHTEKSTSRFSFYDEGETLKQIKSPEFTFTEASLYEALAMVGGYIHGIPRLKVFFSDGKPIMRVQFDYLGQNSVVDLKKFHAANGRQYTVDSEQFCTAVDSYSENVVPPMDNKHAIGAPGTDLYQKIKAEEGEYRVTETSAVFATEYPIEKIHSVKVRYENDGSESEIDITKYIYEQAEYAALSSFSKTYPNSKQYALYYVQGEKNIRGLNFEKENPLSQIFEDPAIVAIYEHAGGGEISDLFTTANQMKFSVQIQYTPILSFKARQRKGTVNENAQNILMSYNQTANKIDSAAYGRNLAGTVSRLGNPQIKKLFVTERIIARQSAKDLVGKITSEDEVITAAIVEYFTEYAKVQLETTKDFNRISQYVGIKSNIRQYEISEKLSQDRHVVYEDFLVVSEKAPSYDSSNTFMPRNFYAGLLGCFFGTNSDYKHKIDCVMMQGYVESGNKLPAVFLPVVSLGVGRSMAFHFSCLDNYGAGYGVTTDDSSAPEYRLQNNVRYCNSLGEIETLNVYFYNSLLIDTNGYLSNSADSFPAVSTDDTFNFVYVKAWSERTLGTPFDNRLVVRKDNRERLCFTYQIHMVSDCDIVVSPSAGENLGFTNNDDVQLYIHKLRFPLGKYDTKIPSNSSMIKLPFVDVDTDTKNYDTNTYDTYFKLYPTGVVTFGDQEGDPGKAWAVTDASDNIVFYKNTYIAPNQALPTLYLSGVHTLEKL